MKTIALIPLALGLTACEPYNYGPGHPGPYPQGTEGYPEPYPPYPGQPYPPGPPMPPGGPIYPGPGQPVGQATYRAIGTEPFWDLEIGRDLVFTDRGNDISVVQPAPAPVQILSGRSYRTPRLLVVVRSQECSDGMSDRSYPDTVEITVDGRQYRGCGAPVAFFSQIGETGQPNIPGPPVAALSGTNWRVVAINGTRTPASNFYLNFLPDRIGAKFGCNSLGASYTQNGNIVTAGPVMATRMACPDMTFENQGSRVLERPMTVSGLGERITLSNARGSIELVQAR